MISQKKIWMIKLAFIMLMACNPQSRLQTLNFFFDGVPDPVNDSLQSLSPAGQKGDLVENESSTVSEYERYAYHAPYQDKNCTACHDRNDIGTLVQGEPDLCYGCHLDFNQQYDFLHGPVDAGFCSTCHEPHMSREQYLLTAPGNELCTSCNLEEEVQQPLEHKDIGEDLCISCHDPHGKDEQKRTLKRIPLER